MRGVRCFILVRLVVVDIAGMRIIELDVLELDKWMAGCMGSLEKMRGSKMAGSDSSSTCITQLQEQ
jgi:hypothetical protein